MANPIRVLSQPGVFLVALTLIGQLAGAQWQKEAQLANAALQKISIKQIRQGQVAGMPLDFGVQLQNGKGQPLYSQATCFWISNCLWVWPPRSKRDLAFEGIGQGDRHGFLQ